MLFKISEKSKFKGIEMKEEAERIERDIREILGDKSVDGATPIYIFGIANDREVDILLGYGIPHGDRLINFLTQRGITATQSGDFVYNRGRNVGISTSLRRKSITDAIKAAAMAAIVTNALVENL